MDRGVIFPGQVPLETDLLFAQRASMVGLAKFAGAIIGTSTQVNGLTVTQTSVASMNVQVAPGEIYMLASLDATAYSSLPADTTHSVMKQGVLLDNALLALTAPGTAGFSTNYLIQATFNEVDSVPVVLPYYNASNPGIAYSGPANSGATQNTRRLGMVVLSAKAGTSATTGSQTTPAPDSGYVGLYVVTVANGATTVVNANISQYPGAPFIRSIAVIPGRLLRTTQYLNAGGSLQISIDYGAYVAATSSTFAPLASTASAEVELQGAGGGGGGSVATGAGTVSCGAGGGGGGYQKTKLFSGLSGLAISLGLGGTGVVGAAGNNGAVSTFGTFTANGGGGGGVGVAVTPGSLYNTSGGIGGTTNGASGAVVTAGGIGDYGLYGSTPLGGKGGATPYGPGGGYVAGTSGGTPGAAQGTGGGGGCTGFSGAAQKGGDGIAGLLTIREYS